MKLSSIYTFIIILFSMTCSFAGSPEESGTPATGIHESKREPVFAPIHPLTGTDENVYGNPQEAGKPFVLRIRELPGAIAAPHTHTFDENITVLQGTWYFGIGDHFDSSKLHELAAGSFVFIPSGTPMFGYAPEAVIVQVHGTGPYTQKFCHALLALDPIADDKTIAVSPSSFRFHKDDFVQTPHGSAHIRQGYATGNVIEYEVVGADGNVFMAQEHDLRPHE
jgi:quercetin dioxygenase-like cupin family protein